MSFRLDSKKFIKKNTNNAIGIHNKSFNSNKIKRNDIQYNSCFENSKEEIKINQKLLINKERYISDNNIIESTKRNLDNSITKLVKKRPISRENILCKDSNHNSYMTRSNNLNNDENNVVISLKKTIKDLNAELNKLRNESNLKNLEMENQLKDKEIIKLKQENNFFRFQIEQNNRKEKESTNKIVKKDKIKNSYFNFINNTQNSSNKKIMARIKTGNFLNNQTNSYNNNNNLNKINNLKEDNIHYKYNNNQNNFLL